MGLLIDTSVLVAVERTGTAPDDALGELGDEPVYLSTITASELLHGVHRADSATRRARRLRFVDGILDVIPVLPFDLEAARVHSRIWADLARTGKLIGAHDLLIAATAVTRGLALLTANRREFDRVDGLTVHLWRQ